MTKISQYSTDVNITGNDKWIGSDAQNFLITKNFTPNNLANYFNENNVIDIGASIRYRYQTLLPGEAREQGTISFETEIGPQVNFSDITTFLIAKNTLKGNTVTQYLDFLVDGKVLLSKASNINIFGYYKITSIEPWIPNTNFFVVEVDFLTGNGFISEDLDYLVSLVDKVQDVPPPVWGSITGDIEDQTDLINYISSQITIPTWQETLDIDFGVSNIVTTAFYYDDGIVRNSNDIFGLRTEQLTGDLLYSYLLQGQIGVANGVTGKSTSIDYDYGIQFYKVISSSGKSTYIKADNVINNNVIFQLPNKATGSYTIATTDDVPATPTLQSVLAEGNTTGGENISISEGDSVILDNGSKLIKGTTDSGNGGNKGIALRCSIDYELKWEAGRLYVMEQDGFTIREVKYNFTDTPTTNDDNTKGFIVGSRWILDNDDVYSCTDDTTGAAVWQLIESGVPTLQQVLDNNHDLVDGNFFAGTGSGVDNTGISVNALGLNAAYQNTADNVNALGDSAGSGGEGDNINAFGFVAGMFNLGNNVNALGNEAGYLNSGNNVNALGDNAGYENIANNVNAMGTGSARSNSGDQINAFGTDACFENLGGLVNAFGTEAGYQNTGNNSNFLGEQAGSQNTGESINALGAGAGLNNTFDNVNLFGANATADENGQTVLSKDGTIMARISTTDLTATHKYNLPDASGTIALLSDIPDTSTLVPYTGASQNVNLGEYELKAGQLTLDTTPTGTATVATTRWNDTSGVSETTLKGGSVILKNGIDLVARVVNKVNPNTTLTKANYQVVRISGAQGQRLAVSLAQANNDNNSADTLGIVIETIAANQEGFIMTVGQLEGINTTGSLQGETWSDGDVLYLSPTTAGRITNIKPTGATGHIVVLGYVEHAHITQGKIYVKIMNGWELDELHNVSISTPLNNQGLVYETSTDLWKNKTIDKSFVGLGNVDNTSDANKPISTATQTALNNKENTITAGTTSQYYRGDKTFQTLDKSAVGLGNVDNTSDANKPVSTAQLTAINAKVSDSITDGVTTIAPSQNAVFDALALKQNILGYTPYKNIQTSQTVHTGTTVETVLFTATIPASAFNATDIIKVLFGTNKLNVAGTYSLRLRINTTNTISGAPTIALYNGTNTAQVNIMMRNFNLNGGNLYGFPFATSGMTDIVALGASLSSTALNPANQFFIFATVTLNNSLDNFIGNMLSISN